MVAHSTLSTAIDRPLPFFALSPKTFLSATAYLRRIRRHTRGAINVDLISRKTAWTWARADVAGGRDCVKRNVFDADQKAGTSLIWLHDSLRDKRTHHTADSTRQSSGFELHSFPDYPQRKWFHLSSLLITFAHSATDRTPRMPNEVISNSSWFRNELNIWNAKYSAATTTTISRRISLSKWRFTGK